MTGRKNVLKIFKVLENEQLNTSVVGPVTDITYLDNVGFQFNVTTSDAYGTFGVEASIDGNQWQALTISPTPSISGSNDVVLINLNQLPFPYVRPIYTSLSGDGYCDGYISAKMI